MNFLLAAEERERQPASSAPSSGVMIWTLIVFGITLHHPLEGRLPADRRGARQAPEDDRGLDRLRPRRPSAKPTSCCAEYRERLSDARGQADEIVARARRTAEAAENETIAEARAKREEMMEQTRRDIEAETRRAIQQIRAEVADLTVLATEKVTRKSLDSADQKRLVEEALAELDFAALAHEERR